MVKSFSSSSASRGCSVNIMAMALAILFFAWITSAADSECTSLGGECVSESECCGTDAVCGIHIVGHKCCVKPGMACTRPEDCCDNEVTLLTSPVLRGLDYRAGICQSGKCCADFGQRCETSSDCCPNGDQPRECYQALHSDKYCRN